VLHRAIVKALDYTSSFFDVSAPTESRRTQLISIFVDYARRNPKRLHDDFLDTAIEALRSVFPCDRFPVEDTVQL